MKIDLKKGDYVETIMVSYGKEYRNRGRVVYATSDIVVVRNPKMPIAQKPTSTMSGIIRFFIGFTKERGHECIETFFNSIINPSCFESQRSLPNGNSCQFMASWQQMPTYIHKSFIFRMLL